MDVEVKKPNRIKEFLKVFFLAILLAIIIIAILYFTNVINFKQSNNNVQNEGEQKNENVDIFKTTDEEIEKIFQKKYSDVYSQLEEGKFLQTTITKELVLGYSEITGYKINLSKLSDYFTDDCINYIKRKFYYTDNDIDYYIIPNNKNFYNFSNTIFGVTNQGKRNIKLILHDNDTVVLKADEADCKGDNCSSKYGGEYIIFKKVNNNWKIEMFE